MDYADKKKKIEEKILDYQSKIEECKDELDCLRKSEDGIFDVCKNIFSSAFDLSGGEKESLKNSSIEDIRSKNWIFLPIIFDNMPGKKVVQLNKKKEEIGIYRYTTQMCTVLKAKLLAVVSESTYDKSRYEDIGSRKPSIDEEFKIFEESGKCTIAKLYSDTCGGYDEKQDFDLGYTGTPRVFISLKWKGKSIVKSYDQYTFRDLKLNEVLKAFNIGIEPDEGYIEDYNDWDDPASVAKPFVLKGTVILI